MFFDYWKRMMKGNERAALGNAGALFSFTDNQ
jgi:hypothetical protein